MLLAAAADSRAASSSLMDHELTKGVSEALPLSTFLAKLLPEKLFQEQKLAIGYRSHRRKQLIC